jgi:ABC-type Mn2+/Zn2+ transport system permease subunit
MSSAPHTFCYRAFVGSAVKENYCIIIGSNVRYTGSIADFLFSLVLVGIFFSVGVFPS